MTTDNSKLTILRLPEVLSISGLPRSTFYDRIKEKLMPPQISLGGRASGFVEHEIRAVIGAMVAGKSKDDIRGLVTRLVEQRKLAA